jgi:hypothetical protein
LPINIIRICFTYKRKTIINYRVKKTKYYAVKAEVVEKTKEVKMRKKLVAIMLALMAGFGLL